ncbi:hypothetical protein TIFTF001_033671 [Ficus carica]|uniref:Uncharacterized protein n=1 Tax=Ficus carica TaxID=3494 RepID=A0AA88DYP3_FICCA|nr:hypothetical protein TIFTF001_033671 [Ficus carica]
MPSTSFPAMPMANTRGANNFSSADQSNRRGSHLHAQTSFTVVYIPTRNYFLQQQQFLVPNHSPHMVFVFAIPVIINLIQLKCQSNGNSPFDTNPMTMWFSISCLLAYCLAYGIELKFGSSLRSPSTYSISYSLTLIRSASHLCGSLCVAFLTSTFFPNKAKPVFYTFFAVVSTGDMLVKYTPIGKLSKWIVQRILRIFPRQGAILPV